MAQKAYFIGPYDSGLVNAVKPWLLTEDAFALMNNAYVWRGNVKKRVGSKLFTLSGGDVAHEHLLSRVRIKLESGGAPVVTDGTGAAAAAIPGGAAGGAVGQIFSIGTAIYTIVSAVAGAQPMLQTVATATATFDSATGNYVFAGAPINTQVYWYPSLPIMGFANYEDENINDEPVIAFDRRYAYHRSGSGWEQLDVANVNTTWTGSDSQFFSTTNYRGTLNDNYWLFAVNNNQADQIKYWNGTQWATIAPATQAAANYTLQTARLIVSFKDRLVALNTIEEVGGAGVYHTFVNRARWCQNGDPVAANAWYDNVPGKGGWIDAPTRQAIISAKILKDRLIVYFERSTWELVYTGNQVLPFIWQNIDDELGAESTFSAVLLENSVLGVGETGVHECDGLRVSRIDDKIPQEVFKVHNNNQGVDRVAGIRDYINELVYWSFPDLETDPTFPTRMLVYNYKNKSWSFNDDSITAFGYYQPADDLTWGTCPYTWEEFDRLWRAGLNQSKTKNVIAGNQEGFTFILDSTKNYNAASLQITNITVPGDISLQVINHNLKINDFVDIQFVEGITNIDGIFKVKTITDADNIIVGVKDTPVGTYTGGGVIARVSKIDILTKQFNFYDNNRRVSINEIGFDVDKSAAGVLNVGFYSSTSATDIAEDALEANQNRLLRHVYVQSEGDCVQLQLTFDDDQMSDRNNMKSTFQLNSMTFHATPTGPR